jgi:hypothetical protein
MFDFEIIYLKGTKNLSDFLSRIDHGTSDDEMICIIQRGSELNISLPLPDLRV